MQRTVLLTEPSLQLLLLSLQRSVLLWQNFRDPHRQRVGLAEAGGRLSCQTGDSTCPSPILWSARAVSSWQRPKELSPFPGRESRALEVHLKTTSLVHDVSVWPKG